jgi:hypothetical protein
MGESMSTATETAAANKTITVPSRFNGPLQSGNGGYSSGVFAAALGGLAEVSLRSPVPLDTPLDIDRAGPDALRALHGGRLVAEARRISGVELDVPALGLPEARLAARGYRAPAEGLFSRCFVCGPAREDSFGVFAGPVEGRDLVASPWTPPAWTAGKDGDVRPEFAWAVLDCPTYFAAHPGPGMPLSMLVRQSTELRAPIAAGEEHVVVAWPLGSEGRKHHAGSAILSAAGETLAMARALLVEAREQPEG